MIHGAVGAGLCDSFKRAINLRTNLPNPTNNLHIIFTSTMRNPN